MVTVNPTSYVPGDGNISSLVNPAHTFQKDGVYLVTLISENECGTDSTSLEVEIKTPPIAAFSSLQNEVCAPSEIEFMNNSSENASSWLWTFEGGTPATSTDKNPKILYEVSGVYDVELIAFSEGGSDTIRQIEMIQILGSPTADFNFVIGGVTANFSNSSINGDTYSWDFGDGETSTLQNPNHSFSHDGEYNVRLIVTNECGNDTLNRIVAITAFPNADFSPFETNGCAPFSVSFEDESMDNVTSWTWSFPGGVPTTSSLQNPMVTYSTPGIYSVQLEVANEFGTDMIIKEAIIEVIEGPTALFDYSSNGRVVNFENLSNASVEFLWDFGDGQTSSMENPTHNYSAFGAYEVMLIAISECGSDTSVMNIEVIQNTPIINIAQSISEGCAPLTINFTDQSTNNPTSWLWKFEGGNPATSTEKNPFVVYEQRGTYGVTVEVTNEFGTSKLELDNIVSVEDTPISNFDFTLEGATVEFDNKTEFAETYLWDFGDGKQSVEISPTHEYDSSGEYQVSLITSNECGSDTTMKTIQISSTSVEELLGLELLNIYPNPNDGHFVIEIEASPAKILNLDVTNILGQKISQKQLNFLDGKEDILMKLEANPGVYFITIRILDTYLIRRIVVAEE